MTPRKGVAKSGGLQQMIARIPVEMHAAVLARAKAEDRTMSMVVRRALKAYLAADTPEEQ